MNFKVDLHILSGELFGDSEDSDAVSYTLLVSGNPLTTIVLFQGSMGQSLVGLKSSHNIYSFFLFFLLKHFNVLKDFLPH